MAQFVRQAFEDSISGILNKRQVDVLHDIKRKRAKGEPNGHHNAASGACLPVWAPVQWSDSCRCIALAGSPLSPIPCHWNRSCFQCCSDPVCPLCSCVCFAGQPYVIVFCGVNGVGKSTNLAKIAYWLGSQGLKVQLAACDTFRAGAVEQLKTHAAKLGGVSAGWAEGDYGEECLLGKSPCGFAACAPCCRRCVGRVPVVERQTSCLDGCRKWFPCWLSLYACVAPSSSTAGAPV